VLVGRGADSLAQACSSWWEGKDDGIVLTLLAKLALPVEARMFQVSLQGRLVSMGRKVHYECTSMAISNFLEDGILLGKSHHGGREKTTLKIPSQMFSKRT
jgi:hypothetical protein